jgi:phosphatidate cytidylyltransferase
MKTRILVSLAMCVVFVPFLFLTRTVAFVILVSVLSALALFEMLRCLGVHGFPAVSIPSELFAAALPFGARYLDRALFFEIAVPASALLVFWVFCVFTFSRDRMSLEQTGAAAAMTLYIAAGFTFLLMLTDVETIGLYLLIMVLIASWMTDTFAYFTGMLFGRHKLIPEISPKKTVEGAVGGTLFTVAAFLVYAFVLQRFAGLSPSYPVFAVGGLFGSLTSQAGDLVMSAVKRKRGIKDYGKIFPGHGGILDRFDSVLAVSVTAFFFESLFDFFRV